ncbi:dCTP deaminase domain-containing protein, partial [Streptomyces lunaelactis]|uniref:dCTP deaminase domain-containing protein n=1 Tax=Streptomyces lunaelactis TaxID=1535768 RepID=UPI00403908DD
MSRQPSPPRRPQPRLGDHEHPDQRRRPVILTGPEITSASKDGRLRISPFMPTQVNPNSYNVRLGGTLLTYTDQVLDTYR